MDVEFKFEKSQGFWCHGSQNSPFPSLTLQVGPHHCSATALPVISSTYTPYHMTQWQGDVRKGDVRNDTFRIEDSILSIFMGLTTTKGGILIIPTVKRFSGEIFLKSRQNRSQTGSFFWAKRVYKYLCFSFLTPKRHNLARNRIEDHCALQVPTKN